MEWIIALIALATMEIILGIDNIVFLAIVTSRLPEEERPKARKIGLLLALGMRIALLCVISSIMLMTSPVFELTQLGAPEEWFAAEGEVLPVETAAEHQENLMHPGGKDSKPKKLSYEVNSVSWRDMILFFGGLFLIWKSIREIHEKMDHHESEGDVKPAASFGSVLLQIALLDIIFSIDSVITAVGMADDLNVMIAAVIIAVAVMIAFANPVSDFVNRTPTIAMLALSFLILIGVMLVAEGAGTHVNKGYIYFAMAFSLVVEMLNLRMRRKQSTSIKHA